MASGVVAISGTLAMLIPPSMAAILYGLAAGQSIGALLIAGIVPGLLVMLSIAATVLWLVGRDPSLAPEGRRHSWSEKLSSLRLAGPMAALMLLVTGTIYLGVATPTEAAGGTLWTCTPEMQAELARSLEPVADDWTERLDARGRSRAPRSTRRDATRAALAAPGARGDVRDRRGGGRRGRARDGSAEPRGPGGGARRQAGAAPVADRA